MAPVGRECHAVHMPVVALLEARRPARHVPQTQRASIRTRSDVAAVARERHGKHPVAVGLETPQLKSIRRCEVRRRLRHVSPLVFSTYPHYLGRSTSWTEPAGLSEAEF